MDTRQHERSGCPFETSLPEVEALALGEGSDLRQNTAIVVAMLLKGQHEILQRIEEHDHDRMPFLARAAAFIGTEALRTLEQGSRHAPDEQCRTACAEMLAEDRERQARDERRAQP